MYFIPQKEGKAPCTWGIDHTVIGKALLSDVAKYHGWYRIYVIT